MKIRHANLVATGAQSNTWFNETHRDDCTYPFILLRKRFEAQNVHLNTPDVNQGREINFEIHIDRQKRRLLCPAYLFLWETPQVHPLNASRRVQRYRRVFTWNDDLVENDRYVKFHMPIVKPPSPFSDFGWRGRDRFCCLISGNKAMRNYEPLDLYSKRLETIRWFERYAPGDFDLYGTGWGNPPARPGMVGRVTTKLELGMDRLLRRRSFSSYRGQIPNKHNVLSRYRFCICYENVRDLPGYVTEKIFDCFYAGCLPIYWGASNIEQYVPLEAFIDRRKFKGHDDLYRYLKEMGEGEYIRYQMAMRAFLASGGANPFSAECFAESVVKTILGDLECLA